MGSGSLTADSRGVILPLAHPHGASSYLFSIGLEVGIFFF